MSGYKTAAAEASAEFTEKRSRFIGYIKPVTREEDALSFIEEIRRRHRDARHNVYAYVIRDNNITRYSDDGEPQGTAGLPVLEVLRKEGVCDVAIVVTRYFGGILLGGGGLLRAYSRAAKDALDAAGTSYISLCEVFRLKYPYPLHGAITKALEEAGAVITKTEFTEEISLKLAIQKENKTVLFQKINEASNGAAAPEYIKTEYLNI